MMLDLTVKITALLGAAWVVAYLLRGRAASARHAVWIGLLAAALALPALTGLVPRIELAWLPGDSPARAVSRPVPAAALDTFSAVGKDKPEAAGARAVAGSTSDARVLPSISWSQWLVAGWAAIALLLLGRVARAHVQARRLLASCDAPSSALTSAVSAAAAELGLAAPPLRVARAGTMPAVVGIVRPSIMLPAEAASWTDERLRVVLLHECAHVRRRDAMLQIVANVATAAYWWHPLAWLAARRVARERELACDDIVIASGTPGARYAEHLLDIARALRLSRQPALAALAMARSSELEGRLIALLDERPRTTRPARALALGIALAIVAVSIVAPLKIVARDAAVAAPQAEPAAARLSPLAASEPVTLDRVQSSRPLPRTDETVQAVPAPPLDVAMTDALWGATHDSAPDIRLLALASLSRSTSPKRVPRLLEALADSSDDIRTMALLSLIHMERAEVVPHLSRALQDESSDVRRAAVMGLSRMEHPDRVELLLKAAVDPSADVRTMAALGLGRAEGAAIDAMLVTLASDASADVRRAAIIGIAQRAGFGAEIGAGVGAGLGDAVANGIAGGITSGIAGALEARLGRLPRKQ